MNRLICSCVAQWKKIQESVCMPKLDILAKLGTEDHFVKHMMMSLLWEQEKHFSHMLPGYMVLLNRAWSFCGPGSLEWSLVWGPHTQ